MLIDEKVTKLIKKKVIAKKSTHVIIGCNIDPGRSRSLRLFSTVSGKQLVDTGYLTASKPMKSHKK